jgi:hypothetical protein
MNPPTPKIDAYYALVYKLGIYKRVKESAANA